MSKKILPSKKEAYITGGVCAAAVAFTPVGLFTAAVGGVGWLVFRTGQRTIQRIRGK